MTRLRLAPRGSRSGFTLIELLVVISIIAVLMSLIAPAVQNARKAARRIQCLNNMHNLAIAVQNFASTNNGQLPPLVGTMTVPDATTPATQGVFTHSWVIPLLPLMDHSALYNSIREASTVSGGVATLKPTDQIYIEALTCPEDSNNFKRALGLSYAANAGYISNVIWAQEGYAPDVHSLYTVNYVTNTPSDTWKSATAATNANDALDAPVALSTGVFWRQMNATDPRVTLDSIGNADGVTQTLMFAENMNSTNWSAGNLNTCGFGVAVDELPYSTASGTVTRFAAGTLYFSGATTANFGQVTPSAGPFAMQTLQSARFNSQPLRNVTGIPRPSSQHSGTISAVMCDGSTRTLSETLDVTVYLRLLTPDGRPYGQPLLPATSY